jgi:hypothetical protein
MDNEGLWDIAAAIRSKNIPDVDLVPTQDALWRIAGLLEDFHKVADALEGIEERLSEIGDTLSTLSAVQEARG